MADLSPLRRRMIEDMTVRNLSPATQRSYINAVQKFSRYFDRSTDRLDLEDVHAFQVHLVSTGISVSIWRRARFRPPEHSASVVSSVSIRQRPRFMPPEHSTSWVSSSREAIAPAC